MRKNETAARGGMQRIKRVGGTAIMKSRKFWFALSLVCAAIPLGCSSSPTNVSISLNVTAVTVNLNAEQDFVATVTGTSNTTVTWEVTGPTGGAVTSGNTTIGTITTGGIYTAPAVLTCTPTTTTPCTVTVTAVSAADTSVTATATVTLSSGITLTVAPTSATIGSQETYPFTDTVTGSTNTAVTWCVDYTPPGGSLECTTSNNNGSIGATSGTYVAPEFAPTTTVTIVATSVQDPSVTADATITVITAVDPTLTSVSPNTAPQGQTFEDVYLTGTNFISTTSVLVNGTPLPAFNDGVDSVELPNPSFASSGSSGSVTGETTTLRARIPDFMLTAAPVPPATTATLTITVERENGLPQSCPNVSLCQIALTPERPAIAGPSPDSVTQGSAGSLDFDIDGGFFGTNANPVVTGKFNGSPRTTIVNPAMSDVDSGRQLSVVVGGGLNANDLNTPGLYPVTVQNNAEPQQVATANLAVRPAYSPPASSISTISNTVVSLPGTTPSAVAIDTSTGLAVVANTGSNDVTLIDMSTGTPNVVLASLCTGVVTGVAPPASCPAAGPTGVAVDNVRHIAIVANNTANNVAVINLTTRQVTSLIDTSKTVITSTNVPANPFSVGLDPTTGRGIVAFQSTNAAALICLVQTACPNYQGPPVFPAISGIVAASTGQSPEIAVDPDLDWAAVTPGGSGALTLVNLGRQSSEPIAAANAATPGAVRTSAGTVTITTTSTQFAQPGQSVLIEGVTDSTFDGTYTVVSVISNTSFTYTENDDTPSTSGGGSITYASPVATLSVDLSVQGISFNPETHDAILTDPNLATQGALIYSEFNQSSTPISLEDGYVASAFNQLTNTGLIINKTLNLALVVDPTQPAVVQELTADINTPVAVACDPITNQFIIINQGSSTAAVYSLGEVRPLQITEVSPQVYNLTSSLTTPAVPTSQTLTIVGGGFNSSSVARLDGVPLPTTVVSSRTLTVNVPAALLSSPRRFALDVLNSGPAVTNGEEFIVTQTVDLTNPGCINPTPEGVAVDPVNNVAVTSLSGCNSVAVVNLSNGMGSIVSVGETPSGVAVLPNVHLAAVANYGSNNVSIVDTVALDVVNTETVASGPLGVDADQNTQEVAVACSGASSINIFNAVTPGGNPSSDFTDQYPFGVAIDPVGNLVAAANAVGNDLTVTDAVDSQPEAGSPYSNMQQPTGVVYDPIGYQFLVASSLSNQVFLVSTISQQSAQIDVGINPASLAYNPFTSTLVTTNTESGTMTVVDLLSRTIRFVLSVNSGSQFSVAIHPWTNVATVADAQDNELVFIPLPR
jgi:DNA-binding beta-propeller fold protein YncE